MAALIQIPEGKQDHQSRGRQPFKLNTSGCCIICLTDVGLKENAVSVSTLFRYLEINLKYEFSTSLEQSLLAPMKEALKLMDKSEIVVESCARCYKTLKKASELVKLLEITRMEVHHCLENFRDWIMESNGVENKMENFQRRIGADLSTLFYLKPIENLRWRFAKNCTEIICRAEPRVRLKKIRMEKFPPQIILSGMGIHTNGEIVENTGTVNETATINFCESESSNYYMYAIEEQPSLIKQDEHEDYEVMPEPLDLNVFEAETTTHSTSTQIENSEDCISTRKQSENPTDRASSSQRSFPSGRKLPKVKEHLKDDKIQCNLCNKIFSRKDYLKLHHGIVHMKIKYPCRHPECNRRFFKHKLLTHEKVCDKQPGSRKCDNCGRTFSAGFLHFETHVAKCSKSKTTKETCSVCHKKFVSKKWLKQHYRRVHDKELDKQDYPVLEEELVERELTVE